MSLIAKSPKANKPKKKETPEARAERLKQQAFTNAHRSIFESAGFQRIAGVDGVHYEHAGIKSELDDIFIYENVIIFAEYTTSSGAKLGSHVKGKSGSHNVIAQDPHGFIASVAPRIPALATAINQIGYTKAQLQYKLVYCSDELVDSHHQAFMPKTRFISRAERVYFKRLTSTIKRSARFELFDFLGVPPSKVGQSGVIPSGTKTDRYHGTILPESHSNFPPGFTIASFYVDPEAILKRAYVLRQDGWRDSLNLYQRMIIPGKIKAIRRYLRDQKRVFANNVVLTLPSGTEFRDMSDNIVHAVDLGETTPVWLSLAEMPNSVGVVDGQHRIFSYYEDAEADEVIDKYRRQQNLLATAIVYPNSITGLEREQFEASLFLEINSNQSGARSDLKQAIWLILDPARPISVARRVVDSLARTAPLNGIIERSAYDIDRIKTTTIATYGIQPLVKRSGKDSLFSIWLDTEKSKIAEGGKDLVVLDRYLAFAVSHISDFLILVQKAVGLARWKQNKASSTGVLSVTTINGYLILMRKLIESGFITESEIKINLDKLAIIDSGDFKSSQYAALATKMFEVITK